MAKRAPRLMFTEEECAAPELEKTIEKVEKSVEKLEKAEAKLPTKTQKVKQRIVDPETGNVTTRLFFEDVDKKRPVSKLSHAIRDTPLDMARSSLHRKVREESDDNVGTEAANTMAETGESAARITETAYHRQRLKPYRRAERAEAKADKANLNALNKEYESRFGRTVNPYSKWQQRQAIKREYAAAKAGGGTVSAYGTAARAAVQNTERTGKVAQVFVRRSRSLVVLGLVAALLLVITAGFSSCSVLFQGLTSSITATSYPLTDADMLSAEAQYSTMELELQSMLATYEQTHSYDEYHYDLDEIEHDPYVLISAITSLMGGEWVIDEVSDELQKLFDRQYVLTETVETEIRTRMETKTGERPVQDPITGQYQYDQYGNLLWEEYEYEEEVPYTYYICYVELVNNDLSHVPVEVMTEEQLSMYATYMSTLGNRPDLFGSSEYVNRYYRTEYEDYNIPDELMADEQFAAIITEAEKYLGMPYVWGGSNPGTSFDCSGFVSYVFNNCGVGWNFGRLSAEGLRTICSPVSYGNLRPGDLIFFEGTYDTPGASHVGIYVGNYRMIHCGDPIQYTRIDTNYWQSHFMQYGRLS